MPVESGLQGGRVVVAEDQRILGGPLGHARRVGHRQSSGGATCRDQQAVDVSMVVAGELDDHFATGEAASQADGAHGGFGTRVDQADFLDRRNGLDDQFGQLVFGLGRRSKAGTPGEGGFEGFDHLGMAVSENHRSPGTDVVDVPVAVNVV